MKASELKQILEKLSPEELELDIVVQDDQCTYDGSMISAITMSEDRYALDFDVDSEDFYETYTKEEIEADYPDDGKGLAWNKGQLLITITV